MKRICVALTVTGTIQLIRTTTTVFGVRLAAPVLLYRNAPGLLGDLVPELEDPRFNPWPGK